MKFIVIIALVLGAGALFGTRRDTPFLRWGIVIALVGVLLVATSTLFAARSVTFGIVLAALGAGTYYYGRVVRREHVSLNK